MTLALGCSTVPSHHGAWAYEDPKTYVGIAFETSENCRFVGAAKGHAGVGAHCSYVRREDTITIVELWDRSGIRQNISQPYEFNYDAQTDTLVLMEDGREIRLSRTEKLLGE